MLYPAELRGLIMAGGRQRLARTAAFQCIVPRDEDRALPPRTSGAGHRPYLDALEQIVQKFAR